MHISSKHKHAFQNEILAWYTKNQRELPWRNIPLSQRTKSRHPYAILVSEIMLQQTQVARVIPKYETWMQSFPKVKDLAHAPVDSVLHHWSGLGYNRRALNLKKTAEIITQNFDGKFPRTEEALLKLPGIGKYTTRALLCFAFDLQVAVVDINVKKVILKKILKTNDAPEKEIEAIAAQLLPPGKAYEWNQALMDYSSIVLKNEKITIPKQSTFIGSHRYYRGQIIKKLLKEKKIPIAKLGPILKKEFSEDESEWLKKLISELEREGFLLVRGDAIVFPSEK